jgi:dimethylargininase
MHFTHAIVRPPGQNFADGISTLTLGKPAHSLALEQHAAYCSALEKCGVKILKLPADLHHPDSTFIEDTAILTPHCAILTRPGAKSREGEVPAMQPVLEQFFQVIRHITNPGTLDGGDICEAGNHFFIGVSHRTNEAGAAQLAKFLSDAGHTSSFVDIRHTNELLHLKSGIAYLSENTLVVSEVLADRDEFRAYDRIRVSKSETYAANCVQVNGCVLIPAGFSSIEKSLEQRGYSLLPLNMSEFQKMDGGLSCLSLRF